MADYDVELEFVELPKRETLQVDVVEIPVSEEEDNGKGQEEVYILDEPVEWDPKKSSSPNIKQTPWQVLGIVCLLVFVPWTITMGWLAIPVVGPAGYWWFVFTVLVIFYIVAMLASTLFFMYQLEAIGSQATWPEIIVLWSTFWVTYTCHFVGVYYGSLYANPQMYNLPAFYMLFYMMAMFIYQVRTHKDIHPEAKQATIGCCKMAKGPFFAFIWYLLCIADWYYLQVVVFLFDNASAANQVAYSVLFTASRTIFTFVLKKVSNNVPKTDILKFKEYGALYASVLYSAMYINLFRSVSSPLTFAFVTVLSVVMDFMTMPFTMTAIFVHYKRRIIVWLQTRLPKSTAKLLDKLVSASDDEEMEEVRYGYRVYMAYMIVSLVLNPIFATFIIFIKLGHNKDFYPSFDSLDKDNFHQLLIRWAILFAMRLVAYVVTHFVVTKRFLFAPINVPLEIGELLWHRKSKLIYTIIITHLLMVANLYFLKL